MTNEEKILQLLESQQAELRKINSRLNGVESKIDGIEARLDRLEENSEITRDGVNALIELGRGCQQCIRFPLPKLK